MPTDYTPIACDLYDRLIEAATQRRPVALRRAGALAQVVIVDISTHDGAEWAQLASGERIRLDAGEWLLDKPPAR